MGHQINKALKLRDPPIQPKKKNKRSIVKKERSEKTRTSVCIRCMCLNTTERSES